MTGRKKMARHDAAPPELLPQNNGHEQAEQQDNRNLVEHGGQGIHQPPGKIGVLEERETEVVEQAV